MDGAKRTHQCGMILMGFAGVPSSHATPSPELGHLSASPQPESKTCIGVIDGRPRATNRIRLPSRHPFDQQEAREGVMAGILQNPDHWRERAEETRTKADGFCFNEKERQRMLRIAAEYDQLAGWAEQAVKPE